MTDYTNLRSLFDYASCNRPCLMASRTSRRHAKSPTRQLADKNGQLADTRRLAQLRVRRLGFVVGELTCWRLDLLPSHAHNWRPMSRQSVATQAPTSSPIVVRECHQDARPGVHLVSPGLLQLTAVRHQRRTTSSPSVGAERCCSPG